MRIRIVTEGASATNNDKGPAARATGLFSRSERGAYLGASELVSGVASAPAGL